MINHRLDGDIVGANTLSHSLFPSALFRENLTSMGLTLDCSLFFGSTLFWLRD